jgi:hypothetical protein
MAGPHRLLIAVAAVALFAVDMTAARPTFKSTWKADAAPGVTFIGKKVAALVITSDDNLRISAEEQLVRELDARRLNGVATYRMAPREVLGSSEQARPWFERAGVEGVVALRPVSLDKQVTYTPSVWTTSSYSTLWGYYGYGWSGVYSPGGTSVDTTLIVETLVYSVPLDTLLWAGVSTTTNPKEAPAFIKELIEAAVKELKKQGLVK